MCSLMHLKTILPYEVIFIDNNADAATRAILEAVGAQVVHEKKQGITHARQKGLECARGQVICTMDPDSIYDPYYIDKMVLPFFKDPGLVLCYSISQSYTGNFQLPLKMKIRNWLKMRYFRWKLSLGFMNRIKFIRAVALAYRREVFAPLGYNTDLKAVAGCDDGLLAILLNNLGRFKYIPVAVHTALPPPRDPGRPFPFCNERFFPEAAKLMGETIKELEIESAP
jgi:glycosyltransferase involved in cell wall biosynthesis